MISRQCIFQDKIKIPGLKRDEYKIAIFVDQE